MATEAQKKASKKYSRNNTKRFAIELNLKNDYEIIKKLEEVPNKQGYIKGLILEDLKKN